MKKTKQVQKMMSQLEDVKMFFEELRDKRQDVYDNKSEHWQDSDSGDKESKNIGSLDDICNGLDSAFQEIDNLFEE